MTPRAGKSSVWQGICLRRRIPRQAAIFTRAARRPWTLAGKATRLWLASAQRTAPVVICIGRSDEGGRWQSADFNHHLPCREQFKCSGEGFIERYLQPSVGDVAAGHPYQLWGCPISGDKFYKIAVFADNDDVLLLGCLKYFRVTSISQSQCSQRKRFDMKLL